MLLFSSAEKFSGCVESQNMNLLFSQAWLLCLHRQNKHRIVTTYIFVT